MIIMTKEQEQTKLSEVIMASEIYESIQLLKELLNWYQKNDLAKKNSYSIRIEFKNVHQKLAELQIQLREAIYQSNFWEER